MIFDWDENKAKINLEIHQVSFDEARLVFDDIWLIEEFDDAHSSIEEKRFTVVGLSETRLLSVTFTVRHDAKNNEIIRLISAREANGLDKKDYERSRNKFNQ